MPGSKLYTLHRVWDWALQFWYFGDFAQFTYTLNESDKYLVEAKTLFEYKQYLLGYNALHESDTYFSRLPLLLKNAKNKNKNISQKTLLFKSASKKHIEVLILILEEVPKEFIWTPEKQPPVTLYLHEVIQNAITLRKGSISNEFNN